MTEQYARVYVDNLSIQNKAFRALWKIVSALLFTPAVGPLFKGWRRFLLRIFGAKIGKGCRIESSCRIFWPANLEMGHYACLSRNVDCYNVAKITVGDYATVSQRSFLCSASHAIERLEKPLIYKAITIHRHAWVCAEAFVAPGVTLGEGAVLGARAVATRDLEPWSVYAGNPARRLKAREIKG